MGQCAIWQRDGVARLRRQASFRFFVSCSVWGGRLVHGAGRPAVSREDYIQFIRVRIEGHAVHLIVLGSKVSSEFPGLQGISFVDVDLDPLSASGL